MKLMAGLVPDRGRGDWPRRGFAIPRRLTCHAQSSEELRRRKGPETANVITQADYPSSARTLIFWFGCPGESLADNLSHSLTWSLTLDEGGQMRYLAMRGPHGRALSVLVATRPIRHLAVLRVLAMLLSLMLRFLSPLMCSGTLIPLLGTVQGWSSRGACAGGG
jgi:hypothetical protein